MIDEIDRQMSAWASELVGGLSVTLGLPERAPSGSGVSLYLLEIANAPPGRGARPAPVRLHLRYLISTWADRPEEAHRLLGLLVFAALDRNDVEVDLAPLPAPEWAALGLTPRPSFILRAPLVRGRTEKLAPPVTQRLVTRVANAVGVRGVVLGPGDVPLAGALVEMPSMGLVTRADAEGRFRFPRVPAEPPVQKFRVRAKGRVELFDASLDGAPGEPITIRMKLKEGNGASN